MFDCARIIHSDFIFFNQFFGENLARPFGNIFYCTKQSFKLILQKSIHPPTHPKLIQYCLLDLEYIALDCIVDRGDFKFRSTLSATKTGTTIFRRAIGSCPFPSVTYMLAWSTYYLQDIHLYFTNTMTIFLYAILIFHWQFLHIYILLFLYINFV